MNILCAQWISALRFFGCKASQPTRSPGVAPHGPFWAVFLHAKDSQSSPSGSRLCLPLLSVPPQPTCRPSKPHFGAPRRFLLWVRGLFVQPRTLRFVSTICNFLFFGVHLVLGTCILLQKHGQTAQAHISTGPRSGSRLKTV